MRSVDAGTERTAMDIRFPSSEEAGADLPPRDAFEQLLDDLDRLSWIHPGGAEPHGFAGRVYRAEESVRELAVVWERLRQGRLKQIGWNERRWRYTRAAATFLAACSR